MKGKSLLKKIGAVATTVAMIASVGVTAFAADVEYNGAALNGAPIMATATETAGIYKVEIPYKSNVANTIGVTMLSYASSSENTSLEDGTAYGEGMQIVGVDQINAGDATNGIGANGTGMFTFYVSTKGSYTDEADGVIRMDKGERGIVLLSGDAATNGATGYLFQVGKAAGVVTVNGAGGTTTTVEVAPADGTGAAYIKEMITKTPYSVQLNGNNVAADKVTVTAKGADYNAANWQAQTVVYTVSVDDAAYDITNAELTVTYTADPWVATGLKAGTMEFPKADVATDLAATVKGKISTVDFTTSKGDATVAVPAEKLEVTFADSFDAEAMENKTYKVAVKVLEGQYDKVAVGAAGVTTNYTITVTAQDTRTEITSVDFGATNALAIENADAPADLAGIEALVKAHVEAGGVKVNNAAAYPVASLTYATSDSYTKPEGSDAAVVKYTVTAPVGVNIDGYKWAADAQAATFEVTVTVKGAKPAGTPYVFGDANMSGVEDIGDNERLDDAVDAEDWMAILFHATGDAPIDALDDPESAQFAAANVVISGEDETVDAEDWMAILFHLTGDAENPEIGAVKVK